MTYKITRLYRPHTEVDSKQYTDTNAVQLNPGKRIEVLTGAHSHTTQAEVMAIGEQTLAQSHQHQSQYR